MSKNNEPGTQSNPDHKRGANGNGVVTNHVGLTRPVSPAPVTLEQKQETLAHSHEHDGAPSDNAPSDDAHSDDAHSGVDGAGDGTHVRNGVNGVHPSSTTPEVTQEVDAASSPEATQVDVAPADEPPAESTPQADPAAPALRDEAASPTANISTPRSAVKIKGRPGGVSLELGDGDWDELMLLLEERLNAAEGFFRGGRVLLEVNARVLVEEHLRQVRELLEAHEMELAVVRSTAEQTLQVAADTGISITNEDTHDSLLVAEPPLFEDDGPPNAYAPSVYASPPEVVGTRPNHFVHRGSLRSGQVLRKTESIVVIGDVNPGAQVVSGGDVMVWGRLRGIAHAGAEGNRRAVVAAIDFVPTQLRIANLTAIAPERKKPRNSGLFFWKKEPERGPEIARVIDGRIVVEPWDEGKPNGLGMWRKK